MNESHLIQVQKALLVITLLFSCSFYLPAQSDPYPLAKAFKRIDLNPGLKSLSIPMSDGSELSSLLHVPDSDSFDLIIGLHWAVMANANLEFMNCLLRPAISDQPFMIIAPLADYQYWWISPRDRQLIKLVKLARKHLPIQKVYIVGYSDGGTGSLHLLNKYPEAIDGIIAIAASHSQSLDPQVPAVVIHGTKDDLFKFEQVNELMEKSTSEKLRYIVAEDLSHFEACLYVDDLKKGLEWLRGQ